VCSHHAQGWRGYAITRCSVYRTYRCRVAGWVWGTYIPTYLPRPTSSLYCRSCIDSFPLPRALIPSHPADSVGLGFPVPSASGDGLVDMTTFIHTHTLSFFLFSVGNPKSYSIPRCVSIYVDSPWTRVRSLFHVIRFRCRVGTELFSPLPTGASLSLSLSLSLSALMTMYAAPVGYFACLAKMQSTHGKPSPLRW